MINLKTGVVIAAILMATGASASENGGYGGAGKVGPPSRRGSDQNSNVGLGDYAFVAIMPYAFSVSSPFMSFSEHGHMPVTFGPYRTDSKCREEQVLAEKGGVKVAISCYKKEVK